MDKKDLKNLEEKLDDIYGSLSYQNTLLNEIKEILVGFKWVSFAAVIGFVGSLIIGRVWNFFFGY